MFGNWFRWCGVLGGLGLLAACARGPVPDYPPIAHVERAANTEQVPVRFLDVRFEYVFDERGNWQEHLRQRYRILTQQGVEGWGGTAAGWSPWYMARPELAATVQDAGGAIRKLDPAAIAEAPAYPELPDIYGDRRILRAPLPGVHVGSVVTEATHRRTTRPFFAGGSSFQVTFQSSIPRDEVELVVDLPEAMPFNYEVLDARVRKEESLRGGRRHVVFRGRQLAAVEPAEPYSASNVPAWPSLAFSTGESWQRIAAAYEDVMTEKLRGDAGVAELARRSVTPGASDIGKANQLLYALHQRVRYVAVEFGQAAIIPATPAEVLRRTYGDCKDQALVLVSMLRAVGLKATLALLRAGPGEDVRPRLPALDVFNHAIVVVQGPHPFWIDPTSSYARAGELPEGDQGRLALIVGSRSEGLTLTPSLGAKQNGYLEIREIRLQDQGPTRVNEASSGTGVIEQRLRDSFSGSREERESSLVDYVKKQYSADKLIGARFDGLDDVREPLRLTLDAEGGHIAPSELFRVTVPVEYALLTSWLPEPVWNDKPRRGDLRLPFRYQAEVRYRIVPPPHYRVQRMPETPELELGPARMTRSYRTNADGSVAASFKFEIDRERISPAELAALKQGLSALDAEAKDEIELVYDSEALFAQGQPAQAMKLLQQLAVAEPARALPLLRLATKLSELGFGTQARAQARRAVALEPRSAQAARTLGMLLQRDEHGRFQAPGFDYEGARAAYRRALELDDSDLFSKLWLATLLEHDAYGTKYADEASLNEALTLYDSVPDTELARFEGGFFNFAAPNALLNTGRFEALGERAAGLPATYGIAAETHRAGAAAGIAFANRRGLVGELRATALAAAAGAFYVARRYPEAAELYAEAARGKDGAKYASLARILKDAAVVDPARLPASSPEGVVRKAELLVTAAARPADVPSGLLSSRAEPSLLASWWKPRELDALTAMDAPRAVLTDTRAAMMQTNVTGSDALGYRVRVLASGFDGQPGVSYRYVVKSANGYQLRAGAQADLGCEALYRWGQRDVAGAKQWLAWAREASQSDAEDDPLRGAPFQRFWADGLGNVELAAAALCATSPAGKPARDLLLKNRGATGVEPSPLEHAIALGAEAEGDESLQLAAAERLLQLHPGSAEARRLHVEALWSLRRYEEVERSARLGFTRQTSLRGRSHFGLLLGSALAQMGKLPEARRIYQQLIEQGDPAQLAAAYNEAAWTALFIEPRPPGLREQAQLAVELSQRQSYPALHTLAAVLLDRGEVSAAQAVFEQLLELDKTPGLEDSTRYVQGALAEAYGMPEVARELYQSVKPRADHVALASYALAQRRLAALGR